MIAQDNKIINQGHGNSSLIPYLNRTAPGVYIRPLLRDDLRQGTEYPFRTVKTSDPVARIVEASFETDAGSDIKKVFLVMQRDEYRLINDDLMPVSNVDADRCWQKAFSFYCSNPDAGPAIFLSGQLAESSRPDQHSATDLPVTGNALQPDNTEKDVLLKGKQFVQFQSVFFCKKRGLFFHPHCPLCGNPLQLCRDDALLINAGLSAYTTSIRRYMFCPSCVSSKEHASFYIFSAKPASSPNVKNMYDLIADFGIGLQKGVFGTDFPCPGCPHLAKCYVDQGEGEVFSRISPFSFYPFYMLILEAMSVNAMSFLPILSGASLEDAAVVSVQKDEYNGGDCFKILERKFSYGPAFLFDKEPRQFLEILYLKLTFLEDLIQTLRRTGMNRHVYPGFNVDRIWIDLPDRETLLPFLWNFKVQLIDIAGMVDRKPIVNSLSLLEEIEFVGLVWFYTLVANRKQGPRDIHSAIEDVLKQVSGTGFAISKANPVFRPENIFFEPDNPEISIESRWITLWEQALSIGFVLFDSERRRHETVPDATGKNTADRFDHCDELYDKGCSDIVYPERSFMERLASLRAEIKASLFQPEPVQRHLAATSGGLEMRKQSDKPADNTEEICGKGQEQELNAHDMDALKKEDRDISAIIRKIAQKWAGRVQESGVQGESVLTAQEEGGEADHYSSADDDLLQETVIISSGSVNGLSFEPQNRQKDHGRPEESPTKKLDETKDSRHHEDYLEETVVISSDNDWHKVSALDDSNDGDLEKTVVISSRNISPSLQNNASLTSFNQKDQIPSTRSMPGDENTQQVPARTQEQDGLLSDQKKPVTDADLAETVIIKTDSNRQKKDH